jgi:hypothetical protein
MPVLSTMGLKKLFVNKAETSTTESSGYAIPTNGVEWKDLGDVYQDTCTLKDADATETVHKSETSTKKLIQVTPGDTTVELSLMDPDLELLARYFGGTITTDETTSKKHWIRPTKIPYVERCIKIMPEEGLLLICRAVVITPTFNITYSSKGICLVPLKIKFISNLEFDENCVSPIDGKEL